MCALRRPSLLLLRPPCVNRPQLCADLLPMQTKLWGKFTKAQTLKIQQKYWFLSDYWEVAFCTQSSSLSCSTEISLDLQYPLWMEQVPIGVLLFSLILRPRWDMRNWECSCEYISLVFILAPPSLVDFSKFNLDEENICPLVAPLGIPRMFSKGRMGILVRIGHLDRLFKWVNSTMLILGIWKSLFPLTQPAHV